MEHPRASAAGVFRFGVTNYDQIAWRARGHRWLHGPRNSQILIIADP